MVFPHCYRTEHSETHTTSANYGQYYESIKSKKIKVQPKLLNVLQYIDSYRSEFAQDLAEAVKLKSITSNLKYKDEVERMIKFTEEWLHKLGLSYECFHIGYYHLNGQRLRLPSVILASKGYDPRKKTVCVYLHQDVPEPDLSKWHTDPWTLHCENNKMYGNGASCGKGPMMAWFHAIQAFVGSKIDLPVNIRFVIESMHHQNSQGLAAFVATRTQDFFASVQYVVMCDAEWLGPKHPCIIYGSVGILHLQVKIEKTENSKTNIKDDMEKIFQTISDENGVILMKGFNDDVEQVTPDEERVYEEIEEFDPLEVVDKLPPLKRSWGKVKILMSFWRLPSIYVDDTLECTCDKKDTSVVKRNFTLKIVPKQVVDKTESLTKHHIQSTAKKLNIENKVTCKLLGSTRPWFENNASPSYNAARKATIQIYKEDPNMIREDRGREAVTIFDNVLEKNVLVLPFCSRGSNTGEDNENVSNRNYYEGTKLFAAYLFQMSYLDD